MRALLFKFVGWISVSPYFYVDVLISGTSDVTLFGDGDLKGVIQVSEAVYVGPKLVSLVSLYTKQIRTLSTEQDPEKRQPSASQREKTHPADAMNLAF